MFILFRQQGITYGRCCRCSGCCGRWRDSFEPFKIAYSKNSSAIIRSATDIGKWVAVNESIWKPWASEIIIRENSFVINFSKCITVIDSIDDVSIGVNFKLNWVPIFWWRVVTLKIQTIYK